jgi:hypothetical protein
MTEIFERWNHASLTQNLMDVSYRDIIFHCTLLVGLVPFDISFLIDSSVTCLAVGIIFPPLLPFLNCFPQSTKGRGDWSLYVSVKHCHLRQMLLPYCCRSTFSKNIYIPLQTIGYKMFSLSPGKCCDSNICDSSQ